MRPRAGLGYMVYDWVNRKLLSTCNNKRQADWGPLFNRNYILHYCLFLYRYIDHMSAIMF